MSYDIDSAIRRIPHHPKPGILFYDLMPLFESPEGLAACVDGIAAWARPREVDVVLGAEGGLRALEGGAFGAKARLRLCDRRASCGRRRR